MPVLRKREEINRSFDRPMVRTAVQSYGIDGNAGDGVAREAAGLAAERAADYARMMGVAAEDEAIALAKKAEFSTGPNGLPQMPPNPTARMGQIARRTYDRTMEDRYQRKLAVTLDTALEEIAMENMYDMEAYQAAAWERVDQMAADLPDEWKGVFQDVAAAKLVEKAASTGWRETQLQMEVDRTSEPVIADDARNQIRQLIIAGDDAVAKSAIALELDRIAATPDHIMNPAERAAAMEAVYYEVGYARLVRDFGLLDATPGQIAAVQEALLTGQGDMAEKVLPLFKRPGRDTYDYDMAEKAGYALNALLGQANARASARRDAFDAAENERLVRTGQASGSKADKDTLDTVITKGLVLTTPDGRLAPVTSETWLSMTEEQLVTATEIVKNAGFLPTTLDQMFTQIGRGMQPDPAALSRAALIYEALKIQPNQRGQTRDLTGQIGNEDAVRIMEHAWTIAGGTPGSQDLLSAFTFIRGTDGMDKSPARLAEILNANKGVLGKSVTVENVDDTLNGYVRKIFDGGEMPVWDRASEKNRKAATQRMKDWLFSGMTPEEAQDLIREELEGRFAESRYMTPGLTDAAPELHYVNPQTDGVAGAVKDSLANWAKVAEAEGIELKDILKKESLSKIAGKLSEGEMRIADAMASIAYTIYNNDAVPPYMRMENPTNSIGNFMFGEEDLFAILADTAIRRALDAPENEDFREEGARSFLRASGAMRPGIDYTLEPRYMADGRPVYSVFMLTENGSKVPLRRGDQPFILDVRRDFDTVTKAFADINAGRRQAEFEKDEFLRGGDIYTDWVTEETGQ